MLNMHMPTSKILLEKNMQVKKNKLLQIRAAKLHTQLPTQSLHLPSQEVDYSQNHGKTF